jgi:hypothetical protein
VRTYHIKSSERLYNKWLSTTAQTTTRFESLFILQESADISSDELNQWAKQSAQEIINAEADHKKLIKALTDLREETIVYLKNQEVTET